MLALFRGLDYDQDGRISRKDFETALLAGVVASGRVRTPTRGLAALKAMSAFNKAKVSPSKP